MIVCATEKTVLDSPPGVRARRIGIHGPRNAGKTCFLGCLYGNRAADTLHVCFGDSDSLNYLSGVWRDVEAQQLPEATRGMPTDLRLDLEDMAGKRAWPMLLRDYSGALVQPVAAGATPLERQLSDSVKQWIGDAHALLIFVDSSDPSVEQVDALDLLLTELRRASPNGYTLERPVGLVLTKWDRVNPVFAGPEAEEERARAYLQDHRIFKQIYRKLCDAGDRLKLFPVSAFGSASRDNLPPPPQALQSYNLHAPLLWAAQKADEVLFDDARVRAEKILQRRRSQPRRHRERFRSACRQAIQVYENLRRDYLILDGPVAAKIDREIADIRAKRRKRLAALVGVPLVLMAAALGGLVLYGNVRDQQKIVQLVRFLQDHTARDDAALRAGAERQYLRSWSSWFNSSYRKDVQKWLAVDLQSAQAIEAYAAAREQDRTLLAENKIADVIAIYRDFIARNEGTPEAGDAEARVIELFPILEDHNEYEEVRRVASFRTADALEGAYRKAQDYEASPRAKKRMLAAVRAYRKWFEGLQQDGGYSVEVASVSIPKGSDLEAFWGTRPRVVLEMNGERHATEWFKGNNPAMQAQVGPFPFRWGQRGTLKVRVEGRHALLPTDAAETIVEDEKFILGKANGTVNVVCQKGKTVAVNLRCAGAEPPELPAYVASGVRRQPKE